MSKEVEGRWMPEYGDPYWAVRMTVDVMVIKLYWNGDEIAMELFKMGNVFPSASSAEAAAQVVVKALLEYGCSLQEELNDRGV